MSQSKSGRKAGGKARARPAPGTTAPLLVVVHPGSACGSADVNLGRSYASESRSFLAGELDDWRHGVAVIDGSLSDELEAGRGDESWRELGRAIEAALLRAKRDSLPAIRIWGCDDVPPHQSEAAQKLIDDLKLKPAAWRIEMTGAWFDPSDISGCVNDVVRVFHQAGFDIHVRNSAFSMDDDYADADLD